MQYYGLAWNKYADFESRSTRSEYWIFAWVNFLVGLVCIMLDYLLGIQLSYWPIGPFYIVYALASFVPSLAIAVRRLRDGGYPPTHLFFGLIPLIGSILLIVFFCKPSKDSSEVGSELAADNDGYGSDILIDVDEVEHISASDRTVQSKITQQIIIVCLLYFLINTLFWRLRILGVSENDYTSGDGAGFVVVSSIVRFGYSSCTFALPFAIPNKLMRNWGVAIVVVTILLESFSELLMQSFY